MNKIKEIIKKSNNIERVTFLSGILCLVLAIAILAFNSSLADTDSTILRNRTVDGLSFENANLVYENGISTFTVDVYNENKDTYNLKYISINFKDNEGVETTLIGYIGSSIESDTGRKITALVDKDITSSVSLEYVINK